MKNNSISFELINAWKQMTSLKLLNEVRAEIAIYFRYRSGINYFLGFKMEEDDNGNLSDEAFTKDKRESPRLKSWDESASMFFLILDISDYGISRNTSDRLAEIRTRPQRRQTGAQLCKFLTQNSR